jgi:hypothetical protein
MNTENFKKTFDAHLHIFIRTGDRISFGRMEGMQDAIEALELPEVDELKAYIRKRLAENSKALEAQCE